MSESAQDCEAPAAKKIKLDESSVPVETSRKEFEYPHNKFENFVTPEELEKLKEFQVLDEVKSNDEDSNDDDSYSSDGKSEGLPEDEIEKMLEEDLPEGFKGAPKPKEKAYITRQKIVLEEKGVNHFEVLPLDWMMVRHYSGMPVYVHRASRVCTLSKPYFLGKGNTRRHDIPISAIPCLAYSRALEEEQKQMEIDQKIEEQIRNSKWKGPGTAELGTDNANISLSTDANYKKSTKCDKNEEVINKCPFRFSSIVSNKDVTSSSNDTYVTGLPEHLKSNIKDDGNDCFISKSISIENVPIEYENIDKKSDADSKKENMLKYIVNNITSNDKVTDNSVTSQMVTDQDGIKEQIKVHIEIDTKAMTEDTKPCEPSNENIEIDEMIVDGSSEGNDVKGASDCHIDNTFVIEKASNVDRVEGKYEILKETVVDPYEGSPKISNETSTYHNEGGSEIEGNIIEDPTVESSEITIERTDDRIEGTSKICKEASDHPIIEKSEIIKETITDLIEENSETLKEVSDDLVEETSENAKESSETGVEQSCDNSGIPIATKPDRGEVEVPRNRQPVVLPGGVMMPPPRVETVSTSWKTQHLTHEQVNEYCKRLFKFKTVNIMHFMRWADRRKYTKARKTLQYPTLPEGTTLITIPAQPANGQDNGGKSAKRDWVMNMNGRSYLSVFHEYVRRALQKQPVYEFTQLENASTPYQATVYIGGMQYGVGHGSSKRQAKSAAARASIHILIPEMKDELDAAPSAGEPDFSFFDYVGIEDPRITEFCAATCEPSPHAILRTCLLRNFGATDRHIQTEMKKLEFQKIELTMKVGKHSATVVCKNKKTAKQRASQAILQALHPHVRSWGSLLRLYGSRSAPSGRARKLEEQQITLLQEQARRHEPNHAVLRKLRADMRRLRARDAAVVPIGTLLLHDDLPTHSGANLNNVDL